MMLFGEPVTLERIKAAYKEIGLVPAARTWEDGLGGCCPITALFKVSGKNTEFCDSMDVPEAADRLAEIAEADASEIYEFVMGFDGMLGRLRHGPSAHALGRDVRDTLMDPS